MKTKINTGERVVDFISRDFYNIGEFLNEIERMTRPELSEFLQEIKKIKEKAWMYDQLNK